MLGSARWKNLIHIRWIQSFTKSLVKQLSPGYGTESTYPTKLPQSPMAGLQNLVLSSVSNIGSRGFRHALHKLILLGFEQFKCRIKRLSKVKILFILNIIKFKNLILSNTPASRNQILTKCSLFSFWVAPKSDKILARKIALPRTGSDSGSNRFRTKWAKSGSDAIWTIKLWIRVGTSVLSFGTELFNSVVEMSSWNLVIKWPRKSFFSK